MKTWIAVVLLGSVCFRLEAAPSGIEIPSLKWNEGGRSDWINVKTDAALATKAAGDGTTDDTAALQAALNLAGAHGAKRLTVYLPPGHYKITSTLYWSTPVAGSRPWGGSGLWLVGCGRDTVITWAGDAGAAMFEDLGATRTRYSGIVWDAGPPEKAAGFGIAQVSVGLYQSRMRHENEAFIGFTGVNGMGTLVNPTYTKLPNEKDKWTLGSCSEELPATALVSGTKGAATPSAEFMIFNCQFQRDTVGASIGYEFFNFYMWTFQNCDFQDCGTGILSPDGKTVAVDCHFERSKDVDIRTGNGLTFHARRCTSSGSRMFFTTSQGGGGPCDVIEDCWIDGWTNVEKGQKAGAIKLSDRGPSMVFDCKFTHPPTPAVPINITDYGKMMYNLFVSGNVCDGNPPMIVTGSGGGAEHTYDIPAGKLKGTVTSLATMPTRFVKSTWPADSAHILDVTRAPYMVDSFGHADVTTVLQKAIDDAKAAANGTIVYLPGGTYRISAPLQVTGKNYVIQGCGLQSRIEWIGDPNQGTMMLVDTPHNVSLEQFALNVPHLPTLPSPAVACLEMTAKGRCSLTIDGIYSSQGGGYNMEGPGVVLSHLPKGAFVNLHHLDTPLTVNDCGPADIFGDILMVGRVIVSGATAPKTGFLGALIVEGGQFDRAEDYDVSIRDNQDFVASDYYNEQSYNNLELVGAPGTTPGRVTIQSYKQNSEIKWPKGKPDSQPVKTTQIGVRDYVGQLFYGPAPLFNFNPANVTQTGAGPFNLILIGDIFYSGEPVISTQPGCNLIQLGDVWQYINKPPTALPDKPDPLTPEAGKALAAGLDHLRQLGHEDFRINGP